MIYRTADERRSYGSRESARESMNVSMDELRAPKPPIVLGPKMERLVPRPGNTFGTAGHFFAYGTNKGPGG
jgi:hypothetical protein